MAEQIQRDDEVSRLSRVVTDHEDDRLSICGVSGAGGVGKTFLVDHVLNLIDVAHSGFLKLTADGLSAPLRGDFVGLIDQKLALRSLDRPAKVGKDYFPSVREVADAHAALLDEVEQEVSAKNEPAAQKQLISALIRGGQILNKIVPRSKGLLNFAAIPIKAQDLDDSIEGAIEAARRLKALAVNEPAYFPRFARNAIGMTLRNRVRRDLHGVTADHLFSDLSSCVGSRKDRKLALGVTLHGHEFSKLLIILDDFEVLGPVLSDFIFGSLIPRLETADFPTTILIVGRDDFQASNPDWHFRYQRYIRDQIRLGPFTREQALAFLSKVNITGQEAEDIYKYSEGFPFLIKLIRDERTATSDLGSSQEIGSADIPRQFFDRTTRWMSDREIDWFKKLVYLDKVNADTLGWFFASEEVEPILHWFEREGSIRDPRARVFRVRGVIREKVLQHLGTRQPAEHRKMLEIIKNHLLDEETQRVVSNTPAVPKPEHHSSNDLGAARAPT